MAQKAKAARVPSTRTAALEGAMKDVAECDFAETNEVAGSTWESALGDGGQCPYVETSKPALRCPRALVRLVVNEVILKYS